MITRISKVLFGAFCLGIAVLGTWQIISQSILSDVRRWMIAGGVQHISAFGGEYDVSARLMAGVVILLPVIFALSGAVLLLSAFRPKDYDDKH